MRPETSAFRLRTSDGGIAKPAGRERRRRHDDVFPCEPAELLVRHRHAAHGSRHARRQITGRGETAIDVSVRSRHTSSASLCPALFRGSRTSWPARWRANDHESAAAEVAGGGMRDRQRERRGDRRVDRVAASREYARADVGRFARRGHDHAGSRIDAVIRRLERAAAPRDVGARQNDGTTSAASRVRVANLMGNLRFAQNTLIPAQWNANEPEDPRTRT